MGLVLCIFALLMCLGVPLAFSIGIASLAYFFQPNLTIMVAINKMVSMTQSFPLLAVPFFVLAGNLMNETGITKKADKICISFNRAYERRACTCELCAELPYGRHLRL